MVGALAAFLLALASLLYLHGVAQGVTVSTPTLVIVDDNCKPSTLSGPDYPDPGDTITVATTVTNDTGGDAAFRVLFRVGGTTGGTSGDLPVDLLFGGPTYMDTSGEGGANWDDSYGELVNTPTIGNTQSYTAKANFSILRRQLKSALDVKKDATTSVTFRVEVFSNDFSTYYGTATTSQTVQNTKKSNCPGGSIDDAAPVMLNTDETGYTTTDTINIEWSVGAVDEVALVPGWGDTSNGTVDVVRLDSFPSGDPETDFSSGTVEKTLIPSDWSVNNITSCSTPCGATDEDLSATLNYSYQDGSGSQLFTNQTAIAASDLTADRYYIVRLRPEPGAGSSSYPIRQPQWTYFQVSNASATPTPSPTPTPTLCTACTPTPTPTTTEEAPGALPPTGSEPPSDGPGILIWLVAVGVLVIGTGALYVLRLRRS